MNIIETLTCGIQFEQKVCLIYQRIQSSQKNHPESHLLWKNIAAQTEKQIYLIKKALQAVSGQGPNVARIHLFSSRDMENGLAWIEDFCNKSLDQEFDPSMIKEIVYPIVSFELGAIYSPLLKIFDLHVIKGELSIISSFKKQVDLLDIFLKKHRLPSLSPLIENYPFLAKKDNRRKEYSEEGLFRSILSGKKSITLRLKNGQFFSGKLADFDQFSIRFFEAAPAPLLEDQKTSSISMIFPKESILSIQIHD